MRVIYNSPSLPRDHRTSLPDDRFPLPRLIIVHLGLVVVVRSFRRSLAHLSQESGLLLRHALLPLLDAQPLRGPALDLDLLGGFGRASGVGADRRVRVTVHLLESVARNAFLDECAELTLVRLFIVIQKARHVVRNVLTRYMIFVHFGIVLFAFRIVAGE